MELICNFSGLKPGQTLGVAHFNVRLFRELIARGRVAPRFLVEEEILPAYEKLAGFAGRMGRFEAAKKADGRWPGALEYQSHHFQERLSVEPSVVTAFDLHVFDLTWKYGAEVADSLQVRLRRNVRAGAAVVTMFPRTYRQLRRIEPSLANRTFLTTLPTMVDFDPVSDAEREAVRARFRLRSDERIILYPAQLQLHKNHHNLISAAAILKGRGRRFRVLCPGSTFRKHITRLIDWHLDRSGARDVVELPGYVSDRDLRVMLDICDLVVCPSFAEGGAAIIQEAIHGGTIGVCANFEAAQEHLALMGADVPFFDPFRPESIADAIEYALDHRPKLLASNAAACEKITAWTWPDLASRYEQIFDWVSSGSPQSSRPPFIDPVLGLSFPFLQ